MSKTHHYNPALAAKHQKFVEDAVNASTPKARFLQAMDAMFKNYTACESVEQKDAAVADAHAHLAELADGIFGEHS